MISRRVFAQTVFAGALSARLALQAREAAATPLEILLIRHGEEAEHHPDQHLNDAGRARAQRLVGLFPAVFATPDILIAAKSSKGSHRSVETLTPLGAALHVPVDARYDDGRYRQLAKALLSESQYVGKRVLVCWHHSELGHLAALLGAKRAPSAWSGRVYDRVWQLRFEGGKVTFTDRPQAG